ncbi:TonB-dependent receptor [Novosphingobium sp. 9]|uniref:TonB-dependent receptor n=1 Tax=Novosphingobium sp. 9 TaxID=2025349 RepID=UPI0021B54958|nr:TonB-dependent receptor [Novosphingobium sp. 9]
MRKASLLLASAMTVAATLAAGSAQAQDSASSSEKAKPSATGSGDIVVTAQRREQNLEKTPIAITALTSAMLEQRGLTQVQNIAAQTPGLQITNVTASPNAILVALRGAQELNGGSITSESPVAIYIDDVYQSRLSAANYDLADITRVEVLRGPQGTLYGRNSMTGAIKLVTRQPDGTSWANVDVSAGSYQEAKIKASVGTPITENLALAASGFYDDRNDGWQYDEALDQKVGKFRKYGGQVALGITNVPGLTAVLTGRYGVSLTDGMYFIPVDYATNKSSLGNFYDTNSPRKSNGDTWQKSLSLKLGYDLGNVTIKSITAYEHLKDNWAIDFSGGYYLAPDDLTTGFYRSSFGKQHQFTEELQALGKAFDGKLNWIVGAFYFDEHASQVLPEDDLGAFGLTYLPTSYSTDSKSLAVYGQADYALTDKLTVSVGIRHSHDVKHFYSLSPDGAGDDAPLVAGTDKTTASVWTPRFNVQYDLNRDVMLYATIAKGYRAGGFNSLVIANPSLFGTPYKPESVWSYEAGAKIQTPDHRGHLNLAGYYEQLSDLQTLADAGGSGSFIYQNAANAKVWGVEAELAYQPVTGLNLYASGAWTDDKYGKLDPSSEAAQYGADKLPMISRWQYQVGGSYEAALPKDAGSLTFAGDYSYRSSYYMLVTLDPYSKVTPVGRGNASITWKSDKDHFEVYLQSKNVFNSKDYYAQNNFIPGVFAYKLAMEPRTFMAGFRFKF